jgi:hypothetical protein
VGLVRKEDIQAFEAHGATGAAIIVHPALGQAEDAEMEEEAGPPADAPAQPEGAGSNSSSSSAAGHGKKRQRDDSAPAPGPGEARPAKKPRVAADSSSSSSSSSSSRSPAAEPEQDRPAKQPGRSHEHGISDSAFEANLKKYKAFFAEKKRHPKGKEAGVSFARRVRFCKLKGWLIDSQQAQTLKAFPKWQWKLQKQFSWTKKREALKKLLESGAYTFQNIPRTYRTAEGMALGDWAGRIRTEQKNGRRPLKPAQIKELAELGIVLPVR